MNLLFKQRMNSIRKDKGYLSPSRILYEITRHPGIEDYTCIILGKTGPTGKTWLWDKLKSNGYNVVDISESIIRLVDYADPDNYCLVDDFHRAIIIVLNRPLR